MLYYLISRSLSLYLSRTFITFIFFLFYNELRIILFGRSNLIPERKDRIFFSRISHPTPYTLIYYSKLLPIFTLTAKKWARTNRKASFTQALTRPTSLELFSWNVINYSGFCLCGSVPTKKHTHTHICINFIYGISDGMVKS